MWAHRGRFFFSLCVPLKTLRTEWTEVFQAQFSFMFMISVWLLMYNFLFSWMSLSDDRFYNIIQMFFFFREPLFHVILQCHDQPQYPVDLVLVGLYIKHASCVIYRQTQGTAYCLWPETLYLADFFNQKITPNSMFTLIIAVLIIIAINLVPDSKPI